MTYNDLLYSSLEDRGYSGTVNDMAYQFLKDQVLSEVKTIRSADQLPAPVNGVIELLPATTYMIVGDVDLQGSRLVLTGVTCLLGTSSETSSLTSTGLTGAPLITAEYTFPVRHITIKDAEVGILMGNVAGDIAADWYGVNFLNCGIGLDCTNIDNLVFNVGAFLGGSKARFRGTANSIVMNSSIFVANGTAKDLIEVTAAANISRRFRITYSSLIVTGSSTGINFSTSATVLNESYILDTCNFSGDGTYLVGVQPSDNKALFVNNVGINNASDVSQYYMLENETATVIPLVNDIVKVAGTTTSSPVTSKFTNTNNRATYVGALSRFFKVTTTLALESGNNNQIGIYIAKNGAMLPESEVYTTTGGTGRSEGAVCQTLVNLVNGDYIEMFVQNETGPNNITVTEMNVIIE